MNDRPKDPCVQFRNVIVGKSKSRDQLNPQGSDRFQLYLSQEQAVEFRNALDAQIENPNGIKLDMHIKKRQNQQNGNIFDSAFTFVKPVEEQASVRGPAKFVPKATPVTGGFAPPVPQNVSVAPARGVVKPQWEQDLE